MDEDLLVLMAEDPAVYRANLIVRGSKGPALFPEIEQPFQTAVLVDIDRAFTAIQRDEPPDLTRVWFEGTKGTGKDTLASICILWLLAFTDRMLTIQIGAADKAQADELRRAAVGILRENDWLGDFVEAQNWVLVNQATGSRAEIIPADEAGAHGSRPDVCIINELTHHADRGFATTMLDNAAKVPTNVTIILTNHGHQRTWQHQWREQHRQSPRWAFHSYTRPAPWVNAEELADQRRRTSAARFARLWLGEWVGEEESALTENAILSACKLIGPLAGRRFDTEIIFGGLDIGVTRDRTGFAVVARADGEIAKLAELRSWQPRPGCQVHLPEVEDAVFEAHQRFGFFTVNYDPSQCEQMAQQLRVRGVPMTAVPSTSSSLQEMATALLESFNSGMIEIWEHPQLITDLRALKFIERGNVYRLDAARTSEGHADLATAFILALLAHKRNPFPWFSAFVPNKDMLMSLEGIHKRLEQMEKESPGKPILMPTGLAAPDQSFQDDREMRTISPEQPPDIQDVHRILEECGIGDWGAE